ncbi:alpha/beta fold hydrolase [Sphaerimonospora sp. CA-214678]|uniref:alpha/beta fold hydrolase n=1 Tax=Sphaerimonospora sp. CA-214678 TaxID=3240029 RepID=UPI003D8C0E3F
MSGGADPFDEAAGSLITAVVPQPCGASWLLLPGWQQSAAHWTPVARWLAGSGITLRAADLATAADGCVAPRGTLARTEELVDRLLAETVTAEAVIVAGHSAGAPLAVLLAVALPGVQAVVMVEPVASHFGTAPPCAAVPGMPGVPGGLRRLRDQYPMAAEATLRSIDAAARRLPGSEPAGPARGPAPADDRRAARAGQALAATRVPVLVVRGQASALLSEQDARTLAAMAPFGRCVTVPDAGHSPHIDRPRATAAYLTDFAAELTEHPTDLRRSIP